MGNRAASVAHALLERAFESGIREVFANPGTTELPLHEAILEDGRFEYVLGLHEVPVVAMADGFSQALGRPTLVNLHTACGLGNALGMIYNASRSETPLIVTAGQQDRRLRGWAPVLGGNLVAMAQGWTKWAYEPSTSCEALEAFEHAISVAMQPPRGPVFLSLPLDLQLEAAHDACRESLFSPVTSPTHSSPSSTAWPTIVRALQEAHRPLILAGSRCCEARISKALSRFAERWGAPVRYESTANRGRLPLAPSHPLCIGPSPLWAASFAESVAEHDVILACCFDLVRWYLYEDPRWPFSPKTRVIQLDDRVPGAGESGNLLARLVDDPELALQRLTEQLVSDEASATRQTWAQSFARNAREQWKRSAFLGRDPNRLDGRSLLQAIADEAPDDLVVIDEAATTTAHRLEAAGVPHQHDGLFGHRGWALGWGLGCATGVQLAWPHRPVMALIGDGAAAFGIQALWTAAHKQTPVLFVVCHNRGYRILEQGAVRLGLEQAKAGRFLGTRLDNPVVDFVALAQGFGVAAQRVQSIPVLLQSLKNHWTTPRGPLLLEVALEET